MPGPGRIYQLVVGDDGVGGLLAYHETVPRVHVQPMRVGETELILGARHDPAFGPVVPAGFGGLLVELLRDSSVAVAPTDHPAADRMQRELSGAPLLDGVRGRPPIDRGSIADAVVRLSWLVSDLADEIDEIDINLLLAGPGGILAVDSLVLLRDRPDESERTDHGSD